MNPQRPLCGTRNVNLFDKLRRHRNGSPHFKNLSHAEQSNAFCTTEKKQGPSAPLPKSEKLPTYSIVTEQNDLLHVSNNEFLNNFVNFLATGMRLFPYNTLARMAKLTNTASKDLGERRRTTGRVTSLMLYKPGPSPAPSQ